MNVSDLIFGNINLNNELGASKVAVHDFNTMPLAEQNIARVAGSHRSTITSKAFTSKLATASLYSTDTLNGLRAKVGLLKSRLQYKQLPLTVQLGVPVLENGAYVFDETRELQFTEATLDTIEIRYGKGHYVVDLAFILLDPIAKHMTPQELADIAGSTTSSVAIDFDDVDIQGTFDSQYPIYVITVNSVTNGSNPSISVSNGFNTVTLKASLTAADVITVNTDPDELTVKLNNLLVDYSGSMPSLILSDPEITITDTLTARNLDILITNNPRYI